MPEVRGFVENQTDGQNLRVFLAEDPRSYVDLESTALLRVTADQDNPLVFSIAVASDDDIKHGTLGETEFAALFTHNAEPQAHASFDHETGFKRCYSILYC